LVDIPSATEFLGDSVDSRLAICATQITPYEFLGDSVDSRLTWSFGLDLEVRSFWGIVWTAGAGC